MNQAEAKAILKYIRINTSENDKICKGLKAIKEKISVDKNYCALFRKVGLSQCLLQCLRNTDELVLRWTLSVLASCLLEKEFQIEAHSSLVPALIYILKTSEFRTVQHRVCQIIGQQCSFEASCSAFHKSSVVKLIVSVLILTDTDKEKETIVKTLRYLDNNQIHQNLLLKDNALFHVCQSVMSDCPQLRSESLKTIHHFNKWPSQAYFNQLMKGTDNLQDLRKLNEIYTDEVKDQVFEILLTVFSHHSSYSNSREYKTNCSVLDYLCMAKLPYMIVTELNSRQELKQDQNSDYDDLIMALCKFCELNKQWKKFSFNVLPTYHERTWMQLTDCRGISLLVSLLSSHRNNLTLLQTLLRGLLGVEYIHSNRVRVLYNCLEAKLLPLLAEIFDEALKEACDGVDKEQRSRSCHHCSEIKTQKMSSFCKEIPEDLLNMISSSVQTSDSFSASQKSEIPLITSEASTSVEYKQLNNFIFRTRKRTDKEQDEKTKKHRSRATLSQTPMECKVVCTSSESATTSTAFHSRESEGVKDYSVGRRMRRNISENVQIWLNVLEYIVRLLYQIMSVKEDITSICKLFLSKFYHYLSKASLVHPSAVKLLLTIAKNSSSIQPMLDILFIPKLAVDLVQDSLSEDCDQCVLMSNGVNDFLAKLQHYFNHHHQYGQCEVANRLNPSKPDHVKHSCLVAFAHVVKCPKLLNSFLLDHRGLESLLSALNAEPRMRLYGIASLSAIAFNLMTEYSRRQVSCLFCDANHKSVVNCIDLEKKRRRKQLLFLTSSSYESEAKKLKCYLEEEENKNCSFQLEDKFVRANREKLSQRNEVLKGMLSGSFSESLENCVQIKDVNPVSMEMLIHFIYECTCDAFRSQETSVYLELLFIAQMYFTPELQVLAMHHLSLSLDTDHVFPFMKCHIEILSKDLMQHLICSLLSKPNEIRSKEVWVNQVLNSPSKDIFMGYIFTGMTRLLTITSSFCNCDSFRNYM